MDGWWREHCLSPVVVLLSGTGPAAQVTVSDKGWYSPSTFQDRNIKEG